MKTLSDILSDLNNPVTSSSRHALEDMPAGSSEARFAAFVERITYKPGYEVVYMPPAQAGGYSLHSGVLYMKLVLENSYRPGTETLVQFQMAVSRHVIDDVNEKYWRHLIRQFFNEFEQHELDEWLRIDGELMNDPHAGSNG